MSLRLYFVSQWAHKFFISPGIKNPNKSKIPSCKSNFLQFFIFMALRIPLNLRFHLVGQSVLQFSMASGSKNPNEFNFPFYKSMCSSNLYSSLPRDPIYISYRQRNIVTTIMMYLFHTCAKYVINSAPTARGFGTQVIYLIILAWDWVAVVRWLCQNI